MKLVFATNNEHKLKEVRAILGNKFEIVGLKEIGCTDEIPETQDTIEGNAVQKAHYVYDKYKLNCFADDTGLFVDALNGEPGVYSARYAGENCSFEDNLQKLLWELKGKKNRNAYFKTVIALIIDGTEYFFEGIINGSITEHKSGVAGFGYDPVFLPAGKTKTFAELPPKEKNKISHRGIATKKLNEFLQNL